MASSLKWSSTTYETCSTRPVTTSMPFGLPRASIGDLIAGISVALVLIPQSLAYAEIAGVPPYVGLFAAGLPPLLAAPFTSSPYLQTGPVALTSLLTFGALSGLAVTESPQYIELAALLALIVGVTRILLGLLRMGTVAYLMSQPVLQGFTSAAAILIISSQVPAIFGANPGEREGVLNRAAWSVGHPGEWETTALVLAALTVALVLGSRRLHKLFPGVLLVVAGTTIWSGATDYTGSTIGNLPDGFLTLSLALPYGEWTTLLIPGVVIALVGFAEPASISRTFAAADRIPWNANKEFVGNGIANLASSLSGGFPVGGSFSRSSLNRLAGATSIWSGAITGLVVLAALPFASNLETLPRAALGGVVFTAVFRLIQPVPIIKMWTKSAPQAAIATGTFAATLLTAPNVERGVIIGVVLSIAFHLYREMRTDHDHEVVDGALHIRPSGVIWFASTPALEDAVRSAVLENSTITSVVIDFVRCGRLDYSGAQTLGAVVDDLLAQGIDVSIVNVPPHAERSLGVFLGGRCGVRTLEEIPADNRYQWVAPWRRTNTSRP
jgi:SulP family sulfate permease